MWQCTWINNSRNNKSKRNLKFQASLAFAIRVITEFDLCKFKCYNIFVSVFTIVDERGDTLWKKLQQLTCRKH